MERKTEQDPRMLSLIDSTRCSCYIGGCVNSELPTEVLSWDIYIPPLNLM